METSFIPIDLIRISAKRRKGVCPRRVEELRSQIEREGDAYPVRLRALGDGTYTVTDGRHRVYAYREAGYLFVLATIENLAKITDSILRTIRMLFKKINKTS